MDTYPPLALLKSQTCAHLIFFPYIKDSVPCIDAIVVGSFLLDCSNIEGIVTFIIKYISSLEESVCITSSSLTLHQKTLYSGACVKAVNEEKDALAWRETYAKLLEEEKEARKQAEQARDVAEPARKKLAR